MDEYSKYEIIQELNNLECEMYVANNNYDYCAAINKQAGIIFALQKMGYSIKYKEVTVNGDNIFEYQYII